MKTKIKELASLLFMLCVLILSLISILGIWDLVPDDLVEKSMATIALITFTSLIVAFAATLSRHGEKTGVENVPAPINPTFPIIRKMSTTLLITAVILLTLIGVLSIWELFPEEILFQSLSTIAVLAFAFFIIMISCLMNEKKTLNHDGKWSIGKIIIYILVALFAINIIGGLLMGGMQLLLMR